MIPFLYFLTASSISFFSFCLFWRTSCWTFRYQKKRENFMIMKKQNKQNKEKKNRTPKFFSQVTKETHIQDCCSLVWLELRSTNLPLIDQVKVTNSPFYQISSFPLTSLLSLISQQLALYLATWIVPDGGQEIVSEFHETTQDGQVQWLIKPHIY